MPSLMRQFVRVATASTLAVVFMIPQDTLAQSHVVSPAELQKAVVAATQARQKNLANCGEGLEVRAYGREAGEGCGVSTER
jgi:hypothetical protein